MIENPDFAEFPAHELLRQEYTHLARAINAANAIPDVDSEKRFSSPSVTRVIYHDTNGGDEEYNRIFLTSVEKPIDREKLTESSSDIVELANFFYLPKWMQYPIFEFEQFSDHNQKVTSKYGITTTDVITPDNKFWHITNSYYLNQYGQGCKLETIKIPEDFEDHDSLQEYIQWTKGEDFDQNAIQHVRFIPDMNEEHRIVPLDARSCEVIRFGLAQIANGQYRPQHKLI